MNFNFFIFHLVAAFSSTPPISYSSPIENLKILLYGTGIEVDKETESIIQRYHGDWLRGLSTVQSAIELVETASRHYHQTTKARIARNNHLLLDGIFHQTDSNSAELYRAFRLNTSEPKIVKFGSTVNQENECFKKLGMSCNEAMEHYIVPIEEFIVDDNGKTGLVIPVFACSLACFNEDRKTHHIVLEDAVFKGTKQILEALVTLHSRQIIHNDIKPGNIFIDFKGNWYLGDWGSCYAEGLPNKNIRYSAGFTPADWPKWIQRNSVGYDKLLLVISVLVSLGILNISTSFVIRDIFDAVEVVANPDLKQFLYNLLPNNNYLLRL